jgi:hypothetical protein
MLPWPILLPPLMFALVAAELWAGKVITNHTAPTHRYWIRRDEEPTLYWAYLAVHAAMALMCSYFILGCPRK